VIEPESAIVDLRRNHVLAALPGGDWDQLRPSLQRIVVPQRHTLYKAGDPITHVYFVEHGVVSVLASVADGGMSEVGIVGPEGLVGLGALLGAEVAPLHKISQCPCTVLRVEARSCKAIFDESATFRRLVLQRVQAFMAVTAQISACNRYHDMKRRFARRLLMAADRLGSDIVLATHEFLASALGVRRVGITTAAGALRRAGLIRYHNGEIEILDRQGLEAEACPCYGKDKEWYCGLIFSDAE
jgi:CRP-like cAMP-binding protein